MRSTKYSNSHGVFIQKIINYCILLISIKRKVPLLSLVSTIFSFIGTNRYFILLFIQSFVYLFDNIFVILSLSFHNL